MLLLSQVFLGAITVFGEVLLEDVFMVGLSMMCNQLSQKFKILFLSKQLAQKVSEYHVVSQIW